jgi:hypothetical protein
MRPVLGRVSREIVDYVRAQGLDRSEFALVGAWNERTDRISLVLGTTRPVDGSRWYSEILSRLRESFDAAGQPWATWNIGLVIRSVRDLDQLYLGFRIADDEEDVTALLEDGVEAAWGAKSAPSVSGQ